MSDNMEFVYNNLFLNQMKKQNISVFLSGAEQVGTSWCTLSLAQALNMRQNKVLAVDGNGGLSNISSYIMLQNPCYLEDYILGKKTLNQLVIAYKNRDFNFLIAKPGNKFLLNEPVGRIQLFSQDLQILSKNYDFTLIDLGSDINNNNLSLLQIAKNVIILCSEESVDLIKTLDLIKFINSLGFDVEYKIIINKVNSFEDGYKVYERLNRAVERNGLNFPELLGIIRQDARIRDTIRNKELLLTRYPMSEAAQDISDIVTKLSQGV